GRTDAADGPLDRGFETGPGPDAVAHRKEQMQTVGEHDDEHDGRRDPGQKVDLLPEEPHAAEEPDDRDDGGNARDGDEGEPAEEEPGDQERDTERQQPEDLLIARERRDD